MNSANPDSISDSELLERTEAAYQTVLSQISEEQKNQAAIRDDIKETKLALDISKKEVQQAKRQTWTAGVGIFMVGLLHWRSSPDKQIPTPTSGNRLATSVKRDPLAHIKTEHSPVHDLQENVPFPRNTHLKNGAFDDSQMITGYDGPTHDPDGDYSKHDEHCEHCDGHTPPSPYSSENINTLIKDIIQGVMDGKPGEIARAIADSPVTQQAIIDTAVSTGEAAKEVLSTIGEELTKEDL